jgi:hypothetical protein
VWNYLPIGGLSMEEHLLEKEVQKILIEDLESKTTPDGKKIRCYVYGTEGFMPTDHKKRFDILIFHGRLGIASPIAIELKPSLTGFSEITKALHDQIPDKYMGKTFCCKKENWSGTPPLFAFTTKTAVFNGKIYVNNYADAANFFVNRFAWRFNVGVLYKIDGKYWLTYQNKQTCLEDYREEYQIGEGNKGNRKW